MTDTNRLDTRDGLPEALSVLLREIPREAWETHPHFGGMVQFWLQRHMMFRELLQRLRQETRQVLAGESTPERFAPRLSRLGGVLLQELHGHHRIEDLHYFPRLARLDARLETGFDLLEADHRDIDALLHGFAEAANAVLRADADAMRDPAGRFDDRLTAFERLLDRHLSDEEDLIVPVILKNGFDG